MTMYRKEALESRIKGFSNPVTIRGSLAVHVMLAGILIVAAGLIAFGMMTDYTRKALVPGYLRPVGGAIVISASRSGQLLVDTGNGEAVEKGQRLARILTLDTDAEGKSLTELEISGLEQALRLAGERLRLARRRLEPLEEQAKLALAQHRRDIEQARITVKGLKEQLDIAKAEERRSRSLAAKGLVTKVRLQEARSRLIRARQELADAEGRLAMLQARTRQVEIDWQERRIELRQTINRLEQEERDLRARIRQARSKRETGIFAPVAGTVTYAAAQNGATVAAGTQLFRITPRTARLQAVLLAPSSAIGFVKKGDVVWIRYAAFPYREHGVFEGRVIAMDKVAQPPQALDVPLTLTEPVYRLTVDIEQSPKSKKGHALRLSAGMTLEASIIIDRKPLLLWLLSPIL